MSGLAQLLAKLYSDPDRIRFLVRHAQLGVAPEAIDFGGPVNVIWDRVLEEAEKRQCLGQLVMKVKEEFPARRDEVAEELQHYHQACAGVRSWPVITGPHEGHVPLVECAGGNGQPAQEVMKALSVLVA